MIDKKRLLKTAEKLISIDSQNPPGEERRIAVFVRDYLDKLGLETKIYEFKERRANVVACLKAEQRAKSLLVSPHLDTVCCGENWKLPPLRPTVRSGKLYGLGATDCKGNIASLLESVASLVEEKQVLRYNLILAITADEETGSALGLIPLLKKGILRPDEAVILDSDDFSIIVAQKGLLHFKVKLKGKRAHGAYPWRGRNAIDMAVKILAELKSMDFSFKPNPYLRQPTLNIGTIRGGDKVNIVADWCQFEGDFRFLPGMSAQKFIKKLKKTIEKHAVSYSIEFEGIQSPYTISQAHPLVSALKGSMRRNGCSALIKGSEGATVITFFQDYGIPAVATGFGSSGCAHINDEFVKIDNLVKGARVLEDFFKNYDIN